MPATAQEHRALLLRQMAVAARRSTSQAELTSHLPWGFPVTDLAGFLYRTPDEGVRLGTSTISTNGLLELRRLFPFRGPLPLDLGDGSVQEVPMT